MTTQKTENHIILKRIFRIIKDPFKGLSNRRHVMAESGRFAFKKEFEKVLAFLRRRRRRQRISFKIYLKK